MLANTKLKFPASLLKIIEKVQQQGYQIYPVGGCIRDMCLGKEAYDFDLTTDATPQQIQSIFPRRTIATGIKHGTVSVIASKKEVYEITTFRADGAYENHRHPTTVSFSTDLYSDLTRRDFTINALVYDIATDKIIDHFDGLTDLQNQLIRTIGKAEDRFTEDALRILRACRFSAQLDFQLHPDAITAMTTLAPLLKNLSRERIHKEFVKALTGINPQRMFMLFEQCQLAPYVMPEQWKQSPYIQANGEILCSPELDSESKTAFLVLGTPEQTLKKWLKWLCFSNKSSKLILLYHALLNCNLTDLLVSTRDIDLWRKDESMHAWRKILQTIKPSETLLQWNALFALWHLQYPHHSAKLNILKTQCTANLPPLSIKDLAIDGNVLMSHFKFTSGKELGTTLQFLLEKVIENPALNTTETLVNLSKEA